MFLKSQCPHCDQIDVREIDMDSEILNMENFIKAKFYCESCDKEIPIYLDIVITDALDD